MEKRTAAKLVFLLSLIFLCLKPEQKRITIYSIGDSTMADYDVDLLSRKYGGENYPIRGWMMMIRKRFNDEVEIVNAAKGGRSSKSFREEGHWKKIESRLKPGDYVFIQFGGNDSVNDINRYTEPNTTFRQYLTGYVKEAIARKAYPVLFTPLQKRTFRKGDLIDQRIRYVSVVRQVAEHLEVPLIDLNKATSRLIKDMGPEQSKKIFMWIEPGIFKALPDGKKDNGHLNVYGAACVADMAVQGIRKLDLPLAKYLR